MARDGFAMVSSILKLLQVYLSFYETRTKSFFFSTREEKLFWERWCIPIQIKERASSAAGKCDGDGDGHDLTWGGGRGE